MCSIMRANFRRFAYLVLVTLIGMYVFYSLAFYDTSFSMKPLEANIYITNQLSPRFTNGETHLHGRHVQSIWLAPVFPEALPQHFRPDLHVTEIDILLNLLRKFRSLAEAEGWSYFLMGSSLLGAYRHQGLVPWEGLIVFAMDAKHKMSLQDRTSSLLPDYHLHEVQGNFTTSSMKFYSYYSEEIPGKEYKYPYVQINFYQEQGDQIIVNNGPVGYETTLRFTKSWIFPLHHTPLWNINVPAPHNTKSVLETTEDLRMCHSKSFDPRREQALARETYHQVLCTSLWSQFPFVLYHKLDNSSDRLDQVLWKHSEFITAV